MALGMRVVAPYVVYGKSGAGQKTKVAVTVLKIRFQGDVTQDPYFWK